MFYKIYQPHPALKGIINNIEVINVLFDMPLASISVLNPPVAEKRLFFYPYELPEVEYVNKSEIESEIKDFRQVLPIQTLYD